MKILYTNGDIVGVGLCRHGSPIVLIKDLKPGIVSPYPLKLSPMRQFSSNNQKFKRNYTETSLALSGDMGIAIFEAGYLTIWPGYLKCINF
ncbi:hypothetical protein SAMN05660293_05373 [Dyadobacter psychrophilus]|uniref:Uncharacterized protein n=1 Tax=Dyadobacter psychrophilus TaxID=651661 RepID=A0A1T5HDV7_9BACT|nr:hypothetical protein SAMN05660293_05373 [Dyadobacter psychrophilus]